MRYLLIIAVALFATSCHDWKNIEKDLQTRFILAEDNSVIEIPEGYYKFTGSLSLEGKNNVTIKGAGKDKTFLSFKGQTEGAEGIRANNCSNITIQGMTIWDAKGDAIHGEGRSPDQAADEAGPGLVRRKTRPQLGPADQAADQIGHDVGRPGDDEGRHRPGQAARRVDIPHSIACPSCHALLADEDLQAEEVKVCYAQSLFDFSSSHLLAGESSMSVVTSNRVNPAILPVLLLGPVSKRSGLRRKHDFEAHM